MAKDSKGNGHSKKCGKKGRKKEKKAIRERRANAQYDARIDNEDDGDDDRILPPPVTGFGRFIAQLANSIDK